MKWSSSILFGYGMSEWSHNAINPDVQKRRLALLLHAGYGER